MGDVSHLRRDALRTVARYVRQSVEEDAWHALGLYRDKPSPAIVADATIMVGGGMIMAKDVEGFPVGDQNRAAEIKAALAKSAKDGGRHATQGDTYGNGSGRGGCSK